MHSYPVAQFAFTIEYWYADRYFKIEKDNLYVRSNI